MSTISIAQFHKVFFEESLEGLDAMEAALLALDEGGDAELVHSIFRAAHSIKGGSATFGFPVMAALKSCDRQDHHRIDVAHRRLFAWDV